MALFSALSLCPTASSNNHSITLTRSLFLLSRKKKESTMIKRMKGYNVMQPMGFDAFGLPAENAAIKRGIQARTWTLANIDNMRNQLKRMGAQWDWQREMISCLPEYYKWSQWLFLQFYKHGL